MGVGVVDIKTLYNPEDFDYEANATGYAIKYKQIPIGSEFHEIPKALNKKELAYFKANNSVIARKEILKLVKGTGNKEMLKKIARIEELREWQK